MAKKNRVQSHGLKHQQIEDLKQDQMSGYNDTVEANKNSDYEIPANEKHLVHAVIEVKTFNPNTGEKTSNPFVQSFYPKEFARMEQEGAFLGKDVEVIHEAEELKQAREDVENGSDDLVDPATLIQKNGKKDAVKILAKDGSKTTAKTTKETKATKAKKDETQKGEKSLDEFTHEELLVKYKELWGEDASADATDGDLVAAISDKLNPGE